MASKLDLIMQLDCLQACSGADSEWDRSAELHTLAIAERECDLVLFAVDGGKVLRHREWHGERSGLLTHDSLLDVHSEVTDGDSLTTRLLISEGKNAAISPWPVGVVENFELNGLSRAGREAEDLLGFALADGTSMHPFLRAIGVVVRQVVVAPFNFLCELFWLLFGPLAPFSNLGLENLNHFFLSWWIWGLLASGSFVGLAVLGAEDVASQSCFAAGEALHQSVDELHGDLAGVLALLLGSLLRDRDLGFRCDQSLEQSQFLTLLLAVDKVLEGPLGDGLDLNRVLLGSWSLLLALLGLDAEGDLVV